MQISGSVALVTGANRGLGQVYARELISRGAAKVYGASKTAAWSLTNGIRTELGHDLPPQAALAVYERAADGLLAAVRAYDDVESPVGQR
jgi:NAD(P)-dependent dehydrogenase (short-subunit alcohol dehydrogenase family)